MIICKVYLLSIMSDCVSSLADSQVWPALHASSGYWQIMVDKFDNETTAFNSDHRRFQFIRMPFGLQSTLITLQPAIDNIVFSVYLQVVLVYLDDI